MDDHNKDRPVRAIPAPPNPVQHEVLFRLDKTRVSYVCEDARQGLLLCWNVIRRQCKSGRITRIHCPDKSILEGLAQLISGSGLLPLIYIEGDTVSSVRQKITGRKKSPIGQETDQLPWQYWKRRVVRKFRHAGQNLFGERSYRVLGREWLESGRQGSANILEARIDPSLFQFTPQEFYLIRGRVEEAETIFNPQLSRISELQKLHHRFFTDMEAEEAEEWLYDHLDEAARYTRELLQRLHKILAVYKKYLQTERFGIYAHFQEEIDKVRDRMDAAKLQYGDMLFQNNQGLQGRLKQSFSTKVKELDQVRKQLKLAYMELHRSLEQSVFQPYMAGFEDLSMSSITALLDQQEQRLKDSWPAILGMAEEGQLRLNSRNMEGSEEQKLVIRQLEDDIEAWFRHLNEQRIFEKSMEENALSLPKKGEILGHILLMIEESSAQLPRFIPYHRWRSFTIHLPEPVRHLLELLGEERNGNWVDSFETWYFNQLLARYQGPGSSYEPGQSVSAMWHARRTAELDEWLSLYAGLEPDGGWLTRLNEQPDDRAVDIFDQKEWDRLFPVQIFHTIKKVPSDDEALHIVFHDGKSPIVTPESYRLLIGPGNSELAGKSHHRIYDPRKAWEEHRGVLQVTQSDKIKGIRPFAESLIYEIAPARLFQSKDMLIVSRWPPVAEEMLLKRLGKNMKAQQLDHEDDAVALMEGLLNNDRELYLLVEEGFLELIDPVWEKMVIEWCKEAGFRVLSLDWQHVWQHEHDWLEQITGRMTAVSNRRP